MTTAQLMNRNKSSLVKIGGSLGIASSFIALAIFLTGLLDLPAVFMLSILPILMAGIGMVLSIVGGVLRVHGGEEETQPIAAVFTCLFGLLGGLIEWYIWHAWPISSSMSGPH